MLKSVTEVHIEPSHNDTSGLYDEMATLLCENINICQPLLKNINYSYSKKYQNASLPLDKLKNNEITKIKNICNELQKASFIEKAYQNKDKFVIKLHDNPNLQRFFNGIYLEWYIFMIVVKHLEALKQPFSISRSVVIKTLDSKYELDVVFVLNNQLVVIECKSGEIVNFVAKYNKIKQIFKLPNQACWLVANNLDNLNALQATHQLNFSTLATFDNDLQVLTTAILKNEFASKKASLLSFFRK